MRIGAACEVVDHCRYDIRAWIETAQQRGYSRIALWGHSLGGVKSIYYQAHTQDPHVCCIVAISPPFLSYEHYMSQPEGQAISEAYHHAQSLVEADHGDDLFEVPGPLPRTLSSAAQYMDKYGPGDRYNILKMLPEISCPIMITLGTEEAKTMLVFRGFYDQIQALEPRLPLLQTILIQDADHRYSGVREKVLDAVMPWLNSQLHV